MASTKLKMYGGKKRLFNHYREMFSSKSRKRRRNYHTITAHSAKKELGENGV